MFRSFAVILLCVCIVSFDLTLPSGSSESFGDGDTNPDTDLGDPILTDPIDESTIAPHFATEAAQATATTTTYSSSSLTRRLLFHPILTFDSVWSIPSFPGQSTAATPATLDNPNTIHIAVQALDTPKRFKFEVAPMMRVGSQKVGFDWTRMHSVGVVSAASSTSGSGVGVTFTDRMPSWIQYVAPSTHTDTTFTLVVTPPQAGDRATVYTSPQPVILSFRGILQYQHAPPPQPEEDDYEEKDEEAEATPSSTPSAASTASTPPLVVIEEVQYLTLLVSLSIMPPFTSRATDMASSYSLTQTPNLLDARNRVTNRRGSPATSKGLIAYRMDWRDEVVYDCFGATGAECDVCMFESSPTSSSSSGFCAFPGGSFFNVASGTLKVRNPITILGNLQINQGATLQFEHGTNTITTNGSETLVTSVSTIECRDQYGISKPIINEGLIVVKKGHVLISSPLVGRGSIHVHPGGSIEFVSLLPASSIFYFNHTALETLTVQNTLGGVTEEEINAHASRRSDGGARKLLQQQHDTDSQSTGMAQSSISPLAVTPSHTAAAASLTSVSVASSTGQAEPTPLIDSSIVPMSSIGAAATQATLTSTAASRSTSTSPSYSHSSSAHDSSTGSNQHSDSTIGGTDPRITSHTGGTTAAHYSVPSSTASAVSIAAGTTATASSGSTSIPSKSPPVPFQAHPSAILVSYGGGILFTHGVFVFNAPFQSSLFESGTIGSNAQSGLNRFVVLPMAHVILDQTILLPTSTIATPINTTMAHSNPNLPTSSSSVVSSPTPPSGHLISFTTFHNLGYLSVWNVSCNFSSIFLFKSFGLLNFTQSSTILFEVSDNLMTNRLEGWNGWRGVQMNQQQKQILKDTIASITTSEETYAVTTTATTTTSTTTATPQADATPEATFSTPSSSADTASVSTSLSSLIASLDGPQLSRCSGGGVGILFGGLFLFRSGKLAFTGGMIGQELSHIFVKRGSEWRIDVEPSGELVSDRTAASFVQFDGIELSLDGVWTIARGEINIHTPLLQIEGHGQLVARGTDTQIHIDTHRVNREIHMRMMMGVTSEAESTELIENEEGMTDPSADLYSLAPANHTTAAAPTIPVYRECLIAPCTLMDGCQSFLISGGARLTLAPLTFLHFLPRARATVETSELEGGSVILDSNVRFIGNAFIQNSTDSAAMVNGLATLTAAVHIGNGSTIQMMDGKSIPSSSSSSAIPSSDSFISKPARCLFAFGNLTGNGLLDCASRAIEIDAVIIYPTFRSPSTFSPNIEAITATTTTTSDDENNKKSIKPAPKLQFNSDIILTERTNTILDVIGSRCISSLSVVGCTHLGGSLVVSGASRIWPFDSPNTASGTDTDTDTGKQGGAEKHADTKTGNVTEENNKTTSTVDSSTTIQPSGVDSYLLVSSSLGFLPLTSPSHFTSVRLNTLYELLPFGYSLDLSYVATTFSPTATANDSSTPLATMRVTAETQLFINAYAPEYKVTNNTGDTQKHDASSATQVKNLTIPEHTLLMAGLSAIIAFIVAIL